MKLARVVTSGATALASAAVRAACRVALLLGCALPPAGLAQEGLGAPPAEATRQVLVLLEMPAPHYRPDGSYAGGYDESAARSVRRRIARALAAAHGLRLVTDWPLPALGVDCYVMAVLDTRPPELVAERLGSERGVAWAQPMQIFHPLAVHDDPLFGVQPAGRDWHLADLHAVATGRGVSVALIDSGVQRDHPDLLGQVASAKDFVAADHPDAPEIHGTAAAGIIVARADNGIGIAGVAPGAQLHALRACWQASPADTWCTSLSLALALHAAIDRGAAIVNLSLGGPTDPLVQRLIETAQQRGATVVAAADRTRARGGFPASLRDVIAVLDDNGTPGTAVMAPGTDVPTTLPGSRWGTVSGSSYAAAHVSGLLALTLQARGRRAPLAPAVPARLVLRPNRQVDACATLELAAGRCACDCDRAAALDSSTRH